MPHFAEHDDWLNRMVAWASDRGWKVQRRPPTAMVPIGIACGPSERGVTHAVVFSFGDQIWDPHPSRAGLLSVSGIYEFSRIGAA